MEKIPILATQISFIVLTVVMYSFVLMGLKNALSKINWEEKRKNNLFLRVRFALIGWGIVISALGIAGFFQDFTSFPPRFMIVLVVPLITLLVVTFSKPAAEILKHVPVKYIVGLQVFRVFVELLLWVLFLQNIAPVQMTFEGRNFDVLAGITAPFAAYFLVNNRIGLIIWNILGLCLLINIVSIAILSLPTPFRVFVNEPGSIMVTHFPFIWLPGLLVPLAYGLHFLSLRQLVNGKR